MNINLVCKHQGNMAKYTTRKMLLGLILSALISVPLMLIYAAVTSFNDISFPVTVIAAVFAVWALFYVLVRVNVNKTIKKARDATYKYCEHNFGKDGMEYKSYNYLSGVNTFVPYSELKRVYFDKKSLLLRGSRLIYVISRKDIPKEYEEGLLRLFTTSLNPDVFRQKNIPKNRADAPEVILSPYIPPVFTFPEIRAAEYKFDKNDENYVKSIRFKRNPKIINQKKSAIIYTLVFFVFCCLSFLSYFVLDRDIDILRLAFVLLLLLCILSFLFYFSLKILHGKDPFFREGTSISLSINEFYINYRIVPEKPTAPLETAAVSKIAATQETAAFYFAVSECQFIKETGQFFAFFVGSFQPMVLNKTHLRNEDIETLRQILFSRYGNKYAYYSI